MRFLFVLLISCVLGYQWLVEARTFAVDHNFKNAWLFIFPLLAFILIWSTRNRKTGSQRDKYIDSKGYIVLTQENELEHRYIAKQILGRNLQSNEVVHHINGKRTDNQIRNLCLMDHERHEHFHAWLKWKKEKTGRYPTFVQQKRVLEDEYGGTLLEKIA